MSEEYSVIVPTQNTVFARFFYTFIEDGVFSFNSEEFFEHGKATENYFQVDDEHLFNEQDLYIVNELREILYNWPTPKLKNNKIDMDSSQPLILTSIRRLNSIVPGSAKLMMELMKKNDGYVFFGWPDFILITHMKEEGWTFISQTPYTGKGQMQIGTKFVFRK